MLEKIKFIFKDFKKASKYARLYDKYAQNPFIKIKNEVKTYVWVEKLKIETQHGLWQIRPSGRNLKRRRSIVSVKSQRFDLHSV